MDTAPAARCAHHPATSAVMSCERCGDFVCEACVAGPGAPGLCAVCQARAGASRQMDVKWAFDIQLTAEAAWRALKRSPVALWLGGLAMSCTDSNCGGSAPDVFRGVLDTDELPELGAWLARDGGPLETSLMAALREGEGEAVVAAMVVALLVAGFAVLLGVALYVWLRPGFLRLTARGLEAEVPVRVLFQGGDRVLSMLGLVLFKGAVYAGIALPLLLLAAGVAVSLGVDSSAALITGLVSGAAFAAAGAYAWAGLSFADYLVTFDEQGVWRAVERSWELTRGRRGWLVLFRILTALMELAAALLGLLLLCVGVLVTVPAARAVAELMFTGGYLRTVRGPQALPPPPPPSPPDFGVQEQRPG